MSSFGSRFNGFLEVAGFRGTSNCIFGTEDEEAAAGGAFFTGWFTPVSIFAIGITVAGIKWFAAAGAFLDNLALVTSGTRNARFLFNLLNIFTIGVAGATEERPEFTAAE